MFDIVSVRGMTAAQFPAQGPLLSTEDDARDLIGNLFGSQADLVILPVGRMAPEFFDLRTRLAGNFIQKFVNYGIKLAFVGDLSKATAQSNALRDFVREAAGSSSLLFVRDLSELATRLSNGNASS